MDCMYSSVCSHLLVLHTVSTPHVSGCCAVRYCVVVVCVQTEEGFGFNVMGGSEQKCPLYISRIIPNGYADRHGQLRRGDQLISVNGVVSAGNLRCVRCALSVPLSVDCDGQWCMASSMRVQWFIFYGQCVCLCVCVCACMQCAVMCID